MLELIKPNTHFDFVGYRKVAIVLSIVLNVASLLALLVVGAKYGIDFAGGTLLHVRFKQPVAIAEVRGAVDQSGGDISVQDFGTDKGEYLLRIPESASDLAGLTVTIREKLDGKFGAASYEVLRSETVGPRVGSDLRQRAVLAVIFATIMMGAYIAFRFELRFGVGAAVALVHDVMMTIGALILFGYEFDLGIVAALLTIVGFSVNDTVIVSDRIRENLHKHRRMPLADLINLSINETLSRTILTTGTALLVVLTLYLMGGSVIHGFAFALLVGFTVGTYSSIFIASPIVLAFEKTPAASLRSQKAEA